ncbi:MAG: beta-lactamase family protein [Acidobacteriia bacterium]|nr:beta-lactamase family protein [Terriglobia bacterium]
MPNLRLRRTILTLCLAAALSGSALVQAQDLAPAVPESVDVSSERLGRLTSTLQGYVADQQLAGAVALVARHGRIVYHEAVGMRDVESSDAMRKDAIFRIASQTKALVSAAVMVLQEQGRLLISDRLSKYLPEFEATTVAVEEDSGYKVEPSRRPVTLRDLLTHTAGIDYGQGIAKDRWAKADIQGWYFAHREEVMRDTVARMASLPFAAHPGERFVYGYNTDILGAVIERVSGQSLDVFLREAILDPLGMDDSHFYLPPDKTGRLATVYSARASGLKRAPEPGLGIGQGHYVKGPRVSFSGGAGLLSTAKDYARFLQMMLNGGSLDGRRVLSRKSVELMTVDHLNGIPFRAGQGFGLGFSVVTDLGARGQPGSVGEFGWGGAYHSTYWVDPQEGLVVVYLTQLIPANGLDEHSKLRALVYQALTD